MLDYTVIAEDTWDLYAPVQEPDPWEPVMRDLSQGKVISLPYTDGKDRRKIRLGIARRATKWGFKTEVRYTESELAVRRVDTGSAPGEEQPLRRRRKEPTE